MQYNSAKDVSGTFQVNADCSDELPPDYEMSVGGPPTNPISAASEITVNESSVVLDSAGRAIGLQQLHPDADMAPQAGESYVISSSKFRPHTSLWQGWKLAKYFHSSTVQFLRYLYFT